MPQDAPRTGIEHPLLRVLMRKNVLAGLMFIGVAGLGLWLSRHYPIGTMFRMGTGYMPRLLCWALLGLGAIIVLQGLLERDQSREPTSATASDARTDGQESYWPILFVAASLIAFALSIERLGLLVAIVLLVVIASLAYRGLRWWETAAAAAVLAALSWVVFVLGLGMTVPFLPEL